MLAACLILLSFCGLGQTPPVKEFTTVVSGHSQMEKYLPMLQNKRVAVLTNASGKIGHTSLVDTLLSLKVNVKKVFVPEHGFRGDVEAGQPVSSAKDAKTGLPVISLYGKNKKPTPVQMSDIDVLLYDIQDLGVRFYTYISTMSYAMEACAENNKTMIVLDRPNPNGFYVDGPVLQPQFKSFLGLHPVPVVYGMTCGEYALMVNGEGWLNKKLKCKLEVVGLENYDRKSTYKLPVQPSPNIRNYQAVLLYPGLGLFEGTIMSLARGTPWPFQMVGHPQYPDTLVYFIPKPDSIATKPRYAGKKCYGIDLRDHPWLSSHAGELPINWLVEIYARFRHEKFFEATFNQHAGNSELQAQIKEMIPPSSIRDSWREDLEKFQSVRKKYLLYDDVPARY